ncbi:MAG: energy transducer TonB [Thermodesulfovibrio sp.]|nr:energy transducer TonB [Thermodesulfovibrio sp.]
MKQGTEKRHPTHTKRNKAAGFVAVFVLHSAVLYGLWSYQIIPPPAEALLVFANFINPTPVATRTVPLAPKPPLPMPIKQEIPRNVPRTEHLLVSSAPVTSPTAPDVQPIPVEKATSGPVTDNPSKVHGAPVMTGSGLDGAGQKPVVLSDDLSVSCTDRPPPVYPKLSARLREQGRAILLVELDELGRVINAFINKTSGYTRLDEAAISAVKTWRCNPAKRSGVAVRAVALQPFNFILKGP